MKKYILATIILIAIGIVFLSGKVNANPSGFYQSFIGTTRSTAGNTATTTLTYMTPGTATTTVYWDSQLGGVSSFGSESAALLVAFTASSSVSTLQVNEEFSQGIAGVDCVATPNACDWYEGTHTDINSYSTSTIPSVIDIAQVPQFTWKFASSTVGGQALAPLGNRATRLLSVQTPTRYARFVITLKVVANGNGAVWADLVAKKQNF